VPRGLEAAGSWSRGESGDEDGEGMVEHTVTPGDIGKLHGKKIRLIEGHDDHWKAIKRVKELRKAGIEAEVIETVHVEWVEGVLAESASCPWAVYERLEPRDDPEGE